MPAGTEATETEPRCKEGGTASPTRGTWGGTRAFLVQSPKRPGGMG